MTLFCLIYEARFLTVTNTLLIYYCIVTEECACYTIGALYVAKMFSEWRGPLTQKWSEPFLFSLQYCWLCTPNFNGRPGGGVGHRAALSFFSKTKNKTKWFLDSLLVLTYYSNCVELLKQTRNITIIIKMAHIYLIYCFLIAGRCRNSYPISVE